MTAPRRILLNSGRRTHAESLPLDGSKDLPSAPLEDEEGGQPAASNAAAAIAAMPDDYPFQPRQEKTKMPARTKPAKITTKQQLYLDHLVATHAQLSIADIALAMKATPAAAGYILGCLVRAGAIEAFGGKADRRYGVIGATPLGEHSRPRRAKRAKAAALAKKRAPQLPRAPQPLPAAAPEAEPKFGFFSDGSLSIEAATCKGVMSQAELRSLTAFCKRFEA